MTQHRRRSGHALAREASAIGWAAPQVVAHRVMRMWLAGDTWSARDRAELQRMSAEKIAAFHESWNAMFIEMARANVELAMSSAWWPWSANPWLATTPRLAARRRRMIESVLAAGLAPVRRRAVANAKRLRRARG